MDYANIQFLDMLLLNMIQLTRILFVILKTNRGCRLLHLISKKHAMFPYEK